MMFWTGMTMMTSMRATLVTKKCVLDPKPCAAAQVAALLQELSNFDKELHVMSKGAKEKKIVYALKTWLGKLAGQHEVDLASSVADNALKVKCVKKQQYSPGISNCQQTPDL